MILLDEYRYLPYVIASDILYFINGYGSKPDRVKTFEEIEKCFGSYVYEGEVKQSTADVVRRLLEEGKLIRDGDGYRVPRPGYNQPGP